MILNLRRNFQKLFLILFLCFFFACKQNQTNRVVEKTEITITLKADANIKLKDPSFLKGKKGVQWKEVKSLATSKIKEVAQGFEIQGWQLEDGQELKSDYKFEKDTTICILSKAQTVSSYKVQHWQENTDCLTYILTEEEEHSGIAWTTTNAASKVYEGFKAKEIEQKEINIDNSTVIKIYYERLPSFLIIDLDGGVSGTKLEEKDGKKVLQGKVGVPVVIEKPKKENLVFAGFNPPLPETFPLSTSDEVYKAQYSDGFVVKIEADERIEIKGKNSIKLPIDSTKTWKDIKEEVKGRLRLKTEWLYLTGEQDYGIYEYRLENRKGITLYDDYKIESDITVYAVSNYIKLKIGVAVINNVQKDNVLSGHEGRDKPRGIIVIPKNVEIIDQPAFGLCEITEVDFSRAVNLKAIENSAFPFCTKLKKVDLARHENLIKFDGFTNCEALEEVDLSDCVNLESLCGFFQCKSLKKVNLSNCSNITKLDIHAFNGCTSLETIDLSPCTKLSKIGASAFRNCTSLKNLKISSYHLIEELGMATFERCTSLTELDLSTSTKLKEIPMLTFNSCSNLTVTLPESIEKIGKFGFYGFFDDVDTYCKAVVVPNDKIKNMVIASDYPEDRITKK